MVVTFDAPVADRHAAERAIAVKSAPAMTGKFQWLDNKVVQWVPDRFWPARLSWFTPASVYVVFLGLPKAGVSTVPASEPAGCSA